MTFAFPRAFEPARLRRAIYLGSTMLVAPAALGADIVPDGATATSVQHQGAVSDVTTNTLHSGFGINSFSRLNVTTGHTVNIHVPQAATGTINIVHERASRIDGTLNSVMGGAIGGTMILANPNGIVVGPDGQVQAGSVGLSTPDAGFARAMFGPGGTISGSHVSAFVEGRAPLNPDADIIVDGKITGGDVRLRAGRDIVVGTTDARARAAQVSAVANTGPRRAIVLDAGRDVVQRGTVRARTGNQGGQVTVRAGRDIRIEGLIDAAAAGNGTGGLVSILAQRDATLGARALIDAHAPGAGDGGKISFSGLKTVSLKGRMTAAATDPTAAAGHIHIDPEELIIEEDMLTAGQHVTLEASERLEVRPGVVISTRMASDPRFAFSAAQGPAGDLTLKAPDIHIMEGAKLLASGSDIFDDSMQPGGAIRIEATKRQEEPGIFQVATLARITIDPQVEIIGASVEILATAVSKLVAETPQDLVNLAQAGAPELVVEAIGDVVDDLLTVLDTPTLNLMPARLAAEARISSRAGQIFSQSGAVTIRAEATTDVEIDPGDNHRIGIIGVQTDTTAVVDFASSERFFPFGLVPQSQFITATGKLTIEAITYERQKLVAQGAAGGFAAGMILSDRTSEARVGVTRQVFDYSFGPLVDFGGETEIRAKSLRDIDLRAVGATENANSLAVGVIVSRQNGTATLDGIRNVTAVDAGITLEAVTRYDRLHIRAEGQQARLTPLEGTQADTTPDTEEDMRALAYRVEDHVSLEAEETTPASADAADAQSSEPAADKAVQAGISVGLAGVFVAHDDVTRIHDLAGSLRLQDSATFSEAAAADPARVGDLRISARAEFDDVEIGTKAQVNTTNAGMLAVTLARINLDTAVEIERFDSFSGPFIQTPGDIYIEARNLLPGHDETTAADMTAIGALDAEASLSRSAALPDLASLITPSRARIAADVSAPGAARGIGVAASIVRGRLEARVRMDEIRVDGPFSYTYPEDDDWDNLVFPEAFYARALRVRADQNGTLLNQAGGNPPVDDAKSSFGAGIAVTDLEIATSARMSGGITAHHMTLEADQSLTLATVSTAGAGPGFNLTGAFSLANVTSVTRAEIGPRTLLLLRHQPGVEADERPAPTALVLRGADTGAYITLAGVAQTGGPFSIGVSAAVNRIDAEAIAALGESFELLYEPDVLNAGGYYDTRPIFFDNDAYASSVPGSEYAMRVDGADVTARQASVILAAAAAGASDPVPEPDAEAETAEPLRETPKSIAGVSLSGDEAFEEKTVETDTGQDLIEDGRNPAQGKKAGFGFSGAFASNAGLLRTQVYVGTSATLNSSAGVSVMAEDAAQVLALTGALVPTGGTIGVSGAMSHARMAREARAFGYGAIIKAKGSISFGGQITGRDVVISGSAAGKGASALALAGALSINSGSRTTLLRMGALDLRAETGQIALLSQDTGAMLTAAGAAEAPLDDAGKAVPFGIGVTVAIDHAQLANRLELARFTGREDQGLAAPRAAIVLSAKDKVTELKDEAGEPLLDDEGNPRTETSPAIRVLAASSAKRVVLARSEGTGGRFALAASVAILPGRRNTELEITADLSVSGQIDARAETGGDTLVRAGADASLPEGKGLGVGVAFVWAQETRGAKLDLRSEKLHGSTESASLGAATILAVVDGKIEAVAKGGASATPPEAEEDAEAGASTEAGAGTTAPEAPAKAGSIALNGSVAINRSRLEADAQAIGQGTEWRLGRATFGAQISESAERKADAGGKTEAGEGIGIGLGFALLTGHAQADTKIETVKIGGSDALTLKAEQAAKGTVSAVNGAVDGATNIGVNIAGIWTRSHAKLALGDLSDPAEQEATNIGALSVTTRARDVSAYSATADAVGDKAEGSNRIVAGLAGVRVQAEADARIGGATLRGANGAVAFTVEAAPKATSKSNGTDALSLDVGRVATETAEDGSVTRKGAFNLDVAGALTDTLATATLALRGTHVIAQGNVTLESKADLASFAAGFVDAQAALILDSGANLVSFGSVTAEALATSKATITGREETDQGAQERAKSEDRASLVSGAGKSLLAGALEDDDTKLGEDGKPTEGDGASAKEKRSAFKIGVSPESAKADAQITATGASIGAVGDVTIAAKGTTDLTLGASETAIAGVVGITETVGVTSLRDVTVGALGGVSIMADVVEKQTLTARLGKQATGAVDVAGVVSIRDSRAVVLVDNDLARSGQSGLFGTNVNVHATTTRALAFDATASSGADAFLSIAGVVSFGDALTAASLGGAVLDPTRSEAATSFSLKARSETEMSVTTAAQSGKAAKRPEETKLVDALDRAGTVLMGFADDLKDKAAPDDKLAATKDDGSEAKIAEAFRLALSVLVAGQSDRVEARLGGVGVDATGGTVALGAMIVGAGTVTVSAENIYKSLKLRGLAYLGEPEEKDTDPTQVAASVAVSFFGIWSDVLAEIGEGALVATDTLKLEAVTELDPKPGAAPDLATLRAIGAKDNSKDAFDLTPDDSAPPEGFDLGDDWTLSQGAAAFGENVSLGIDVAVVRLKTSTEAVLSGNVLSGAVTQRAETRGGFSTRTGAAFLSDDLGAPDTAGIGGGVSILAARELTRARIGETATFATRPRLPQSHSLSAESKTRLTTLGLSTSKGGGFGFSGGLGITIVNRDTEALVDPDAVLADTLEVSATDKTIVQTAGLAQTVSDSVSVGLSAALNFGTVNTRAIYGRRGQSGGLIDMPGAEQGMISLALRARSEAVIAAYAAAGSGSAKTGPKGGISLQGDFSSIIGEKIGEFGKTEETKASPEQDFGFGFSGAFAGTFGRSRTEALAQGGTLSIGTLTLEAESKDLILTMAGGIVRGAKVDGIAGAAALNARASDVLVQMRSLDLRGTIDAQARNLRVARALSAGTKGFARTDFSVAGAASLDVGAARAEAVALDVKVMHEDESFVESFTLGAGNSAETVVVALGDAAGEGFVFGLSYTQSSVEALARAEVMGAASRIHADRVAIRAVNNSRNLADSFAAAATGLESVLNITAAVSLMLADIRAQARVTGGEVVATESFDLAANSATEGDHDALTFVKALRRDVSAASDGLQLGGSYVQLSGTREFEASARGAGVGIVSTGSAPQTPIFTIRAADQGLDDVRSGLLVLGLQDQGSLMAALILRQGNVRAGLGNDDADAPTLLANPAAGALAEVSAVDARNSEIRLPQLAGSATGSAIAGSGAIIIDRRATEALVRDITIVSGLGRLRARAERTGDLSTFIASAAVAAGGTSVAGNGSFIFSSGDVRAEILGAQVLPSTLGPGAFGRLEAEAKDSGNLGSTILTGQVSTNAGIGLGVEALELSRNVTAQVDDSETRVMAVPVLGMISAKAKGESTLKGYGGGLDLGAGVTGGLRVLSLTQRRDIFAAVGGPVLAGGVAVLAERADVLDVLQGAVGVSGAGAATGRIVHILHGGATEAVTRLDGLSDISGDVSVRAQDRSTLKALTLSAGVGGQFAGGLDVLVLRLGSADGLDASEQTVSTGAALSEVDALRLQAAAQTDSLFRQITSEAQAGAPLRMTGVRGQTLAKVAGGPLVLGTGESATVHSAAQIAGSLSISAETDMLVRGVAGQAAVAGGAGVNAGVVILTRGTRTEASLDVSAYGFAPGAGLSVGGATMISALSKGNTTAVPVGVSVGASAAVGAALSLALDRRKTVTSLSGRIESDSLDLGAESEGDVTAVTVIPAVGGSAGVGVGLALAIDNRETASHLSDAHVTTKSAAAAITAKAAGDTFALAVSGAVGGSAGVAYAQSLALRSALTSASVTGSTILSSAAIRVEAVVDADENGDLPSVTAMTVPVAAGGTAGVGLGLAIARLSGETSATVTDSVLNAHDSIELRARANLDLGTLGIGVAAGGKAGVGGSVSVASRNDTVRAEATRSTLVADNSVAVVALAATGNEAFAGGTGLSASDAVDLPADLEEADEIRALVAADDVRAREGDALPASPLNRASRNVEVNVALGGVAGVGVTVGVTTLSGEVTARIGAGSIVTARGLTNAGRSAGVLVPLGDVSATQTRAMQMRRGVIVLADSVVAQTGVSVTAGLGGVAGIGAQVTVLSLSDQVRAEIGGTGAVTAVMTQGAQSDIMVRAAASSRIGVYNVAAAGAAKAGVGVVTNTVALDRNVAARIDNAGLISSRDIVTQSILAERVRVVDVTVGGALVGVGGTVTVVSAKSDIQATIARTTLNATGRTHIAATLGRDYLITSVGVSGGLVAVSGTVQVVDIEDKVLAEIEDAPHAAARTEIIAGAVEIAGLSEQTLRLGATSGTIGAVGLGATVLALSHESDVRARVGAFAQLGTTMRRLDDVSVTATNRLNPAGTTPIATARMLSGALSQIGATVAVVSAEAVSEAEIAAQAQIVSAGSVNVTASTERKLDPNVFTFSVAGASLNVLTGLVLLGTSGQGADGEAQVRFVADEVSTLDPIAQTATAAERELNEETSSDLLLDGEEGLEAMEAGLARMQGAAARLSARMVITPSQDADRTIARIATGAQVDANGTISVLAEDLTQAQLDAGGYSGGLLLSAVAGYARVRVNSAISTDVMGGVRLTSGAGDIVLRARHGRIDARAVTGAISKAGGVSLGAAVNMVFARTEVARRVSANVSTGAEMRAAGGALRVEAASHAEARALADGLTIGTVAIGGMDADVQDRSETNALFGGKVVQAERITLDARTTGMNTAKTDALGIGFLGEGALLGAEITDSARTIARLSGEVSHASTRVEIRAQNDRAAQVDANGTSAALGVTIAGSFARLSLTRETLAQASATARITAAQLTMEAGQGILANPLQFTVNARAGGGALAVGVAGARAVANLGGSTRARLDAAQVSVSGGAIIGASGTHRLSAETRRVAIGVINGGAGRSEAISTHVTAAHVNTQGTLAGVTAVRARMTEELDATAIGAAGGAGGINGATAITTGRSDTQVHLATRAGALSIGSLNASTSHKTQFMPRADSTSITAIGFAAASALADIRTNSGLRIADNARITARVITLNATSDLSNPTVFRPADAGSGGLVNRTGAHAEFNLVNHNTVQLGANAHLRQTGSAALQADIQSNATAIAGARISTIEAAALPRAEALSVVVNKAELRLGAGAQLRAEGDLRVSTGTDGRVTANAHADTIAVVSNIGAEATAKYTAQDSVTLATDALMESGREMLVQTGRGRDGAASAAVEARATYAARSLLPLDILPKAVTDVTLRSEIVTATGSRIEAGGNVTLETAPISLRQVATARGRNTYTQLANNAPDPFGVVSAIGNALTGNDSGGKIEIIGTETARTVERTGSHIDGTVLSGKLAAARLIYTEGGAFTDDVGNPVLAVTSLWRPFVFENVSATELSVSILDGLRAEQAGYEAAGKRDLADLVALQITEVEALLASLANSVSGQINVVRLSDISVEGASIFISGGYLVGSGSLRPANDITLDFLNQRPDTLTLVGAIKVPDTPGQVILNGRNVTRAEGILNSNDVALAERFAVQRASVSPVVSNFDLGQDIITPVPTITFAAQVDGVSVTVTAAAGSMIAGGQITNRAGLVTLAASQDLFVQGNIIARTVKLQAGGNLIVGLVPGLRSIGPDVQASLFQRLDAPSLVDVEFAPLGTPLPNFTAADVRQDAPAIIASNVSIYGQYVNISGRIEAGGPSYQATIGAGIDTWINTVLLPRVTAATERRVMIYNPFDPEATAGAGALISGNLAVYYDRFTDRIEFDPIVADGGRVRVAGNIVSTGNGEIVVLDGYANIIINSASQRVLRFDHVDTGGEEGVRGRVELIDLRSETRTVYQGTEMNGDMVQIVAPLRGVDGRLSVDLPGINRTLSGREQLHFIPILPNVPQESGPALANTLPYIRYGVTHTTNAVNDTASRIVDSGDIFERPLADGTPFYLYSRARQGGGAADVVVANATYLHTHSFRADAPIKIELRGDEAGRIAIDAAGAVQLAGRVQSENATARITAGGAITSVSDAAVVRARQINLQTASGKISGGSARAPVLTATVDGTRFAMIDLNRAGIDLSALITESQPILTLETALLSAGDLFLGLRNRPIVPDRALQLHVTDKGGLASDRFVIADTSHGAAGSVPTGLVSLEARASDLPITRVVGTRVDLAAQGDIIGQGAAGATHIQSTAGLSLTAREGAISALVTTGQGIFNAGALGNINIRHAEGVPRGRDDLRIERVVSREGSVVITSTGRLLDENQKSFRDLVTEADVLAQFWEDAGLLGDARTARIDAQIAAEEAARQADLALYWQWREENRGGELTEDGLNARIVAEVAAFLALNDPETEITPELIAEAQALAQTRRAAYERGRALNMQFAPAATARPVIAQLFGVAQANALRAAMEVTQADIDVALRADYVIGTTDTQIEVQSPNIVAAGNVTLRGSAIGRNDLIMRLVTAASNAPTGDGVRSIPLDGLGDSEADRALRRELLVLLATSERSDIVVFENPANYTEIWRADDLVVRTGPADHASLLANAIAPADLGYDASVYISSPDSLTLVQVFARDKARVKSGGDIRAISGNNTTLQLRGAEIILEAARGSIGSAAAPIRIEGGTDGGLIDLELRAGGRAGAPAQVHVLRDLPGDVVLGAIVAEGDVMLEVKDGDLLARSAGTFIAGDNLILRASGMIGRNFGPTDPRSAALDLRMTGQVIAEAGTGLNIRADQILRARSIGALEGRVTIELREGDLVLQGPDDGARNPGFTPVQTAAALYARAPVLGDNALANELALTANQMVLIVPNGVIRDAGSDHVDAGSIGQPDIRAGWLQITSGGFGSVDNPIETDLARLSGTGVAGVHVVNDRRGSIGAMGALRALRRLEIGALAASEGAVMLRHDDGITIRTNAILQARDRFTIASRTLEPLRIGSNVRMNDAAFEINAPFAPMGLSSLGVVQGTGNIAIEAARIGLDSTVALATPSLAGSIVTSGDLSISVREGLIARDLSGHRLTLTGFAPRDPFTDLPGPDVNMSALYLIGRNGVSVTTTGNLSFDAAESTHGSVTLNNQGGMGLSTLRALAISAAQDVAIYTRALAQTNILPGRPSVLEISAQRLTGGLGALGGDTVIELSGGPILEDIFVGAPGPERLTLRALGGTLTLAGASNFASTTRIEAARLSVQGEARGMDLDIRALNGLDMRSKDSHIIGRDVSVIVGGPLAGAPARDANLLMGPDARMTALGTLTITTTGDLQFAGLQSLRSDPGAVGIALEARRLVEAGDVWIDLTTNAGVIAQLVAQELRVDPQFGLETQIGALDISVARGDILLREVDDLIIAQARTGQGRIDLFSFGDALLTPRSDPATGGATDTLSSPESIIVTAMGSLFTTAPPQNPVGVSTPRLYLGAIEGSLGTKAQPVNMGLPGSRVEELSLFAGRHIVGVYEISPTILPLVAADTGEIELKIIGTGEIRQLSSAGPAVISGPRMPARAPVSYSTLPQVTTVLEAARYPTRLGFAPQTGPYDKTGLDARPGDVLPPRDGGTDTDLPPATPEDEIRLKELYARAAGVNNSGGAGQFDPFNPLQPHGTDLNRLRLTGLALALQLERQNGWRPQSTIDVDEELRR